MRSWMVVAMVAPALIASRAVAESGDELKSLLQAVEAETRVSSPLRADGELTVASPDETHNYPIALLYRPGTDDNDLYLELGNGGGKALILTNGAKAFRLDAGAKEAAPFPPDAPLVSSEFAREDLESFRVADFRDARISDDSPRRMTVSLVPKRSQYILLVMTIDKERKVPLKVLYYRDTVNNLVKMQRDEDYTLVGRRWLPGTITMEDFKLRTVSTLKLKWSQSPTFPPELFDPTFLARASELPGKQK
jgi:hypothetical protein